MAFNYRVAFCFFTSSLRWPSFTVGFQLQVAFSYRFYGKYENINFRDFTKKYKLKNDTMNESQLQKMYNYPLYPRDTKINSDKGFVNIDDGSMNATHWKCFKVKDQKPYYFDSFGARPDKFLLNQLPKPIIYHNDKIQDRYSKLCGFYCLYFFYLIERLKYYDNILKNVFS